MNKVVPRQHSAMNAADRVVYEGKATTGDGSDTKFSSDEYTSDEESGLVVLRKAGMRRTARDATKKILLEAEAEAEPLYAVSTKTARRQQQARDAAAAKSTNRFSSSSESESEDDGKDMPGLVEPPTKETPGEEVVPMVSMRALKEQALAEKELHVERSRASSLAPGVVGAYYDAKQDLGATKGGEGEENIGAGALKEQTLAGKEEPYTERGRRASLAPGVVEAYYDAKKDPGATGGRGGEEIVGAADMSGEDGPGSSPGTSSAPAGGSADSRPAQHNGQRTSLGPGVIEAFYTAKNALLQEIEEAKTLNELRNVSGNINAATVNGDLDAPELEIIRDAYRARGPVLHAAMTAEEAEAEAHRSRRSGHAPETIEPWSTSATCPDEAGAEDAANCAPESGQKHQQEEPDAYTGLVDGAAGTQWLRRQSLFGGNLNVQNLIAEEEAKPDSELITVVAGSENDDQGAGTDYEDEPDAESKINVVPIWQQLTEGISRPVEKVVLDPSGIPPMQISIPPKGEHTQAFDIDCREIEGDATARGAKATVVISWEFGGNCEVEFGLFVNNNTNSGFSWRKKNVKTCVKMSTRDASGVPVGSHLCECSGTYTMHFKNPSKKNEITFQVRAHVLDLTEWEKGNPASQSVKQRAVVGCGIAVAEPPAFDVATPPAIAHERCQLALLGVPELTALVSWLNGSVDEANATLLECLNEREKLGDINEVLESTLEQSAVANVVQELLISPNSELSPSKRFASESRRHELLIKPNASVRLPVGWDERPDWADDSSNERAKIFAKSRNATLDDVLDPNAVSGLLRGVIHDVLDKASKDVTQKNDEHFKRSKSLPNGSSRKRRLLSTKSSDRATPEEQADIFHADFGQALPPSLNIPQTLLDLPGGQTGSDNDGEVPEPPARFNSAPDFEPEGSYAVPNTAQPSLYEARRQAEEDVIAEDLFSLSLDSQASFLSLPNSAHSRSSSIKSNVSNVSTRSASSLRSLPSPPSAEEQVAREQMQAVGLRQNARSISPTQLSPSETPEYGRSPSSTRRGVSFKREGSSKSNTSRISRTSIGTPLPAPPLPSQVGFNDDNGDLYAEIPAANTKPFKSALSTRRKSTSDLLKDMYGTNIGKWSSRAVCEWIESRGLDDASSKFRACEVEIDGMMLLEFETSHEIMEELGITSKLMRMKIMTEIKKLKVKAEEIETAAVAAEAKEEALNAALTHVPITIQVDETTSISVASSSDDDDAAYGDDSEGDDAPYGKDTRAPDEPIYEQGSFRVSPVKKAASAGQNLAAVVSQPSEMVAAFVAASQCVPTSDANAAAAGEDFYDNYNGAQGEVHEGPTTLDIKVSEVSTDIEDDAPYSSVKASSKVEAASKAADINTLNGRRKLANPVKPRRNKATKGGVPANAASPSAAQVGDDDDSEDDLPFGSIKASSKRGFLRRPTPHAKNRGRDKPPFLDRGVDEESDDADADEDAMFTAGAVVEPASTRAKDGALKAVDEPAAAAAVAVAGGTNTGEIVAEDATAGSGSDDDAAYGNATAGSGSDDDAAYDDATDGGAKAGPSFKSGSGAGFYNTLLWRASSVETPPGEVGAAESLDLEILQANAASSDGMQQDEEVEEETHVLMSAGESESGDDAPYGSVKAKSKADFFASFVPPMGESIVDRNDGGDDGAKETNDADGTADNVIDDEDGDDAYGGDQQQGENASAPTTTTTTTNEESGGKVGYTDGKRRNTKTARKARVAVLMAAKRERDLKGKDGSEA